MQLATILILNLITLLILHRLWDRRRFRASSPPATVSPTRISPSDAELCTCATARDCFGARNCRMASTTASTQPSSPLVTQTPQGGPAALDSGCVHLNRSPIKGGFYPGVKTICLSCGVSLSLEWTPVPAAALGI